MIITEQLTLPEIVLNLNQGNRMKNYKTTPSIEIISETGALGASFAVEMNEYCTPVQLNIGITAINDQEKRMLMSLSIDSATELKDFLNYALREP